MGRSPRSWFLRGWPLVLQLVALACAGAAIVLSCISFASPKGRFGPWPLELVGAAVLCSWLLKGWTRKNRRSGPGQAPVESSPFRPESGR